MTLIKPLISEKTLALAATSNQFTFKVNPAATKQQIVEAVKNQFKVDVIKINSLKSSPRLRRSFRSGRYLKVKASKKAIVSLKKGQTIKYFEIKKK